VRRSRRLRSLAGAKRIGAARRLPWAVMTESIGPGCCRPCYVERFGEREARDLEEVWAKKREGTEGA